jgi:hypothetical protein
MTLYKGIQGFSVQNLSADPTDPNEGQLWYNSTSNVWKLTSATTAGAWASGGNLNTARRGLISSGAGTQTAGLAAGGYDTANYRSNRRIQRFCLDSWRKFSTGTPSFITLTETESYDGTSWTVVPATVNTKREAAGTAGTQTAAIIAGGGSPGDATPIMANSESYNGTSWTTTPSLNTARS